MYARTSADWLAGQIISGSRSKEKPAAGFFSILRATICCTDAHKNLTYGCFTTGCFILLQHMKSA
ncbi:hypothetical protein BRYFOR_05252 [Marvinbryantia formatexigens DSM 14469]|uniref:Uncharacterized protein n=1 Tax=Marvinbryantia formatexigens DSM 14469 TaxID=478749 RepID=C6L9G2_9FIRM|nr:hypothetical protein BRYFOR_05252 [Marvinbryantia formatexigens DSM 14469]